MHTMSPHWREGAMLAIDYGGDPQSVYHRRPHGTLRAYRDQKRLEGEAVLEMPGRQDLTADVNFADLAAWAREAGWREGFNVGLAEFLGTGAAPGLRDRAGAGGAFRVLALEGGAAGGR
jgi:SAM-dependent MidA family methyltransferase